MPAGKSVIGVLCNPASGQTRNYMEVLKRELETIPVSCYHEADNPADIRKALNTFDEKCVDCLIIIGGDGTVHAVLTILCSEWKSRKPVIAVLPGGTTNMTARDLGIRKKPLDCIPVLARTFSSPLHYKYTSREILRIEHAGCDILFGMFFGCGLVTHGVEYFHHRIGRSGMSGEIAAGLVMVKFIFKLLFSPKRLPVTPLSVLCGNARFDYPACLAAFTTTLGRLLLGARPYRRLTKGGLCFTIIDNNIKSIWISVLSLLAGTGGRRTSVIFDSNGKKIELFFDGKFVVDGELYTARQDTGSVSISRAGEIEFMIF